MDNFDLALSFVLKWEGGYSNHPSDTGGETNKGVTHSAYDSYRRSRGLPKQSVRHMTDAEMREIYRSNYWSAAGCDLLPTKLAMVHFDFAVNSGVSRANKALQRLVGTLDDGIIGANTKQAILGALKHPGEAVLVQRYLEYREGCYRRWAVGNQRVFLAGWMNRLRSLKHRVAA